MKKEARLLRIGVLGCGPIAQIAHFEACHKARNTELHAICDVAADLREKMAARWEPKAVYADYDQMLADPRVEAVVVAVADQFHVPLARKAVAAGKHVFVEKPMGVTVEECQTLRDEVRSAGVVLQVGHNRRFDPGVAFARTFIMDEMGPRLGLKAWYHDSAYRYTMTDNLQGLVVPSSETRKPEGDPKADRPRYLLLGHASHLIDTARWLGGDVLAVRARLREQSGNYCWFVDLDFADGCLGHVDLTVAVQGDFEEGFHVYGERGSARGQIYLAWFHKASVVECFSAADRVFRRPLGEDAHTYRLQLEGFADSVLHGAPLHGAGVEDGLAAMQALAAIAQSVQNGERVRLADATGGV